MPTVPAREKQGDHTYPYSALIARADPEDDHTGRLFHRLAHLKEGSPDHRNIRNHLILTHVPMVNATANRLSRRSNCDTDDLFQAGMIGLIKSIDRYDPSRGVPFKAFAHRYIDGEIKHYSRDSSWAVHVPRGMQELTFAVGRARYELTGTLGRSPNNSELAHYLGQSEPAIREAIIAANGYQSRSLDSLHRSSELHSPTGQPPRTNSHELAFFNKDYLLIENREYLRRLLMHLDSRDRKMLVLRYYQQLSQEQIGVRLGISQMQVSRRLARTLAILRQLARQESISDGWDSPVQGDP